MPDPAFFMPLFRRFSPLGWISSLVVALAVLGFITLERQTRVDALSQLVAQAPAPDAASPTGYAGGLRLLIVAGQNPASYQWITQAQDLLAEGPWRVRHTTVDNAPTGRPVAVSSFYRWWLAGCAEIHHRWTGVPRGIAVERAALFADPLLLALFLVAATGLLARSGQPQGATLLPWAAVSLYPLIGLFQPGSPDDRSLALLLAAGSVLVVLTGVLPEAAPERRRRRFALAGVLGGLGLWVNVPLTAPVLLGVGLGAVLAARLTRRDPLLSLPWGAWSHWGAGTVVVTWLIEYAPHHLPWSAARLAEVHPLYALAWLSAGTLLAAMSRGGVKWVDGRIVAGVAGLLVVPALMLATGSRGFLTRDLLASRLSALPAPVEAANLLDWLVRETSAARVVIVLLPLVLLLPAAWLLARAATQPRARTALAVTLGPVLVALALACTRLNAWVTVDALWLVLLVAVAAAVAPLGPRVRHAGLIMVALVLVPGLVWSWPRGRPVSLETLDRVEWEAVMSRDLAHWLARRAGPEGAIALAPPTLTVSLAFHGGIRGLGSPFRENEEGVRAAVRLAGATAVDEAHALVRQRQVTHLVIPSWDDFLDTYARLGANQPEHTLMGLLHRWLPPRWLRPVPYPLRAQGSGSPDLVTLFEVAALQDEATSLSRLTEYFIDMGRLDLATLGARRLGADYNADLGAQVAKARTEIARRDHAAAGRTLADLAHRLQEEGDATLDWDRRVSLALILAQGDRLELARAQLERCFDEMTEVELRTLPPATLLRFLALGQAFELAVDDPELQRLVVELLPPARGR